MRLTSYLKQVDAALGYAEQEELIDKTPRVKKPKGGADEERGRPLSDEEVQLVLDSVEKVVKPEHCAAYRFFLQGLMESGLRLREAYHLNWEPKPKTISVDLSGAYPMFRVPKGAGKSGKARPLPMAPGFMRLLDSVPEHEREGRVFKLPHKADWVGKQIARIGKAAGVAVKEESGTTYSAHDSRRTFGQRLSHAVDPYTLQSLMRHSDIRTTMKNYVGQDAEYKAKKLAGDKIGDSSTVANVA